MNKTNKIKAFELEEYQERRYIRHRQLGKNCRDAIREAARDVARYQRNLRIHEGRELAEDAKTYINQLELF